MGQGNAVATGRERFVHGRLKKIFDTESHGAGNFLKREFILATDEDYPQNLKFELTMDKTGLISPFFVGDEVKVWFNLRGREWVDPNGKTVYFNTFQCWKIQKLQNGYVQPTNDGSPHVQHNYNFPPEREVFGNPREFRNDSRSQYRPEEHDDLPF